MLASTSLFTIFRPMNHVVGCPMLIPVVSTSTRMVHRQRFYGPYIYQNIRLEFFVSSSKKIGGWLVIMHSIKHVLFILFCEHECCEVGSFCIWVYVVCMEVLRAWCKSLKSWGTRVKYSPHQVGPQRSGLMLEQTFTLSTLLMKFTQK
jgi:hypothetical protein